jgi:hypothetical protein
MLIEFLYAVFPLKFQALPSFYHNMNLQKCKTAGQSSLGQSLNHGPNKYSVSGFGGLGISTLALGTQVRGFKPSRSRRIFQGEKNTQRAFLRKGSKTVGPMSLIYSM